MISQEHVSSIFILYLILASNFLGPFFNCRTQTFLNDSFVVKHLLGYFTMVFLVVLANSQRGSKQDFIRMLGTSVILYIWFAVSTKISHDFWLVLVLSLAAIYMIHLYQQHDPDEQSHAKYLLAKVKKVLFFIAFISTWLGLFVYIGENKLAMGKRFSYFKVLFTDTDCGIDVQPRSYVAALGASI